MRPLRRNPRSPLRSQPSSGGVDLPLLRNNHSTSSSTGTPEEQHNKMTTTTTTTSADDHREAPPSPLHLPSKGAQYHSAPPPPPPPKQHAKGGWKSKFKTFFKRNHQKDNNKQERHSPGRNKRWRKEHPLAQSSKDEDIIQFTQSIDENDDEVGITVILASTTPTIKSTPSTLPATSTVTRTITTTTTTTTSSSSMGGRPTPSEMPVIMKPGNVTESPLKSPATSTIATSSSPTDYRLGAQPLRVLDQPNDASTTQSTRKGTEASSMDTPDNNSVIDTPEKTTTTTTLQKQQAVSTYQALFACGPTLYQTATSLWNYPDPDLPELEDSSVSSTSAEALFLEQVESSEERRQRLMNLADDTNSNDAAVEDAEQGMELIFFQEDEEDWSNFPWSQQTVQTEKVDKDIFLSFTEMGFDDLKSSSFKKGRPALDPVPEMSTVASGDDKTTHSSIPEKTSTSESALKLGRASTAPVTRETPPRTQQQALNRSSTTLQPLTPAPIDPIPLARTSPMPSPNRSALQQHESISSDKVVDRAAATASPTAAERRNSSSDNVVDRVSNIIKSVPSVFAKLAESATGPSSESQILLTRSSSQVTWVSHADDFAALDGRPLTEIVIPSPDAVPKPTLGSVAGGSVVASSATGASSTVKAIRNAIFDSMMIGGDNDRAESEHKAGEDEDLDAPLNPKPPRPYTTMTPSDAPPLLLSPSSLTFDSRFQPPLSEVPVRVPSDGEEHPDSSKPPERAAGDIDTPEMAILSVSTPPNPDFDDISDFEDDLFLEDSPPLGPTFQPMPDTPGERRSLMPPRSNTMSMSTMEDDDSVGLNALESPGRRKMSKEFYRTDSRQQSLRAAPPTPPRKTLDKDFGVQSMLESQWDYNPRGMHLPNLTHSSDGDSDSSSDNIDHLLLNQRPPAPMSHGEMPPSYEDASHSSIMDSLPKRTYSSSRHGFDLDSVVETDIDDGGGFFGSGLFSCACWDIPPLIEHTRTGFSGSSSIRRQPAQEGLLEDRVRSDDSDDRRHRRSKKGFGKMISLVRSTSNSFKSIWSRKSHHAEI